MRRFFLTLIISGISICYSQNISVESFRLLEDDLDARVNFPKRDQNGEVCAIIKVVTSEMDFDWDSDALGIVSAERKTGEYWLYVPRGARFLTIKHNLLGILRGYQYPIPIQSAMVYEMRLITAEIEKIVKKPEIVTQWLAIDSEPGGANVFIDEKLVGTTPYTGQFPEGSYTYRIEIPRYHPEAGKITLKGKRETLTFKMRPQFGSISVTSSPESGMKIYLNNEYTGKTTPATLEGVSSGNHAIKLMDKWYQPQAKTVTVNDNQTTTVSFTMEPAFASITVKTIPSADILINGTKKATGTYTDRMLTGIYTLKAELDKHYPEEQQLIVEAGKDQSISLNLKPKAGRADITSTPFDAKITLNGKDYGTTPTTIKDLLVGTYTLTLEKQGYGTVIKTITIAEGKDTYVNETLPTGMEVTITSSPIGAQLWVDGVPVGTTPYKTTLAFSSHSVKLVNGKKEVNETINVTQGGKTRWEFDVAEFPPTGTFTDSRDGKTYKYVTIGKQVWMAENLAYAPSSGNYWAYHNNSSNVAKYGYLYDWQTSKNVCPTGWHLPTDEEWQELIDFAGGKDDAGTKLKAKNGWRDNGNGTDDYGFSALPGGIRDSGGNFNYVGNYGSWWSSTEYNANDAWNRSMYYDGSDVGRYDYGMSWGFSVRCVRDL